MPRARWLPTLLVVPLFLAACGGTSDKAGGKPAQRTVVLRLAVGTDSTEVGEFAADVRRRTNGTIRVDVIPNWRLGQASFEQGLIADVREGKVELGAVASRAWDAIGVSSFRALGAPFLIDSYALQERVLASPIAAEMLNGLRPTGLVGLGLLPGPLRRPLGVSRPLLGPSDYAGLRIGLHRSSVGIATLLALGATPVAIGADYKAARLDGFEANITAISNNQIDRRGSYLTTNVVFWPRTLVIFTSKRTLAKLTLAQQRILKQAVAADLGPETKLLTAFERGVIGTECAARRLRFVAARPADLAALRRAVDPVYDQLDRDPQTRDFIAQIDQMRHRLGIAASAVPRCAQAATSGPGSPSIVDGAYAVTVRPRDLPATARVPEQYGAWQVVFDRGRFRLTENSDTATWVADGGVHLDADTMTWTFDTAYDWGPHGTPDGVPVAQGDRVQFRWRRVEGSLVLAMRKGGPLPGLTVRPLERVGDAPGQQRLEDPSVLQGVWATDITPGDFMAHHQDAGSIPDNAGPLRLTVHGNRYRITQRAPDGFHWMEGRLRFAGDTIEFDESRNDHGPHPVMRVFLHWSVFHDRLTVRAAPGISPYMWGWHAWRRVR